MSEDLQMFEYCIECRNRDTQQQQQQQQQQLLLLLQQQQQLVTTTTPNGNISVVLNVDFSIQRITGA